MFLPLNEVGGIYLQIEAIDFRCGVNRLCAHVSRSFVSDSRQKNIFIFSNRDRKKIRLLYWDDNGFAVWSKSLDKEKFIWPRRSESEMDLTLDQLRWLLSGVDIDKINPHKKRPAKSFL